MVLFIEGGLALSWSQNDKTETKLVNYNIFNKIRSRMTRAITISR